MVCGDVTRSPRRSVTDTSNFLDDLFLTKNWQAGSKLQISNNTAARAAATIRAQEFRGGQAVQAPGHEQEPKAGLRLKQLCRNKVEEPDGHRQVQLLKGSASAAAAAGCSWGRSCGTTGASAACCGVQWTSSCFYRLRLLWTKLETLHKALETCSTLSRSAVGGRIAFRNLLGGCRVFGV